MTNRGPLGINPLSTPAISRGPLGILQSKPQATAPNRGPLGINPPLVKSPKFGRDMALLTPVEIKAAKDVFAQQNGISPDSEPPTFRAAFNELLAHQAPTAPRLQILQVFRDALQKHLQRHLKLGTTNVLLAHILNAEDAEFALAVTNHTPLPI